MQKKEKNLEFIQQNNCNDDNQNKTKIYHYNNMYNIKRTTKHKEQTTTIKLNQFTNKIKKKLVVSLFFLSNYFYLGFIFIIFYFTRKIIYFRFNKRCLNE